MKHIRLLSVLILLIVAVSCKKNHKELISGRLQGTWELRHVEGGYRAPGTSPDYAPGNGIMWKFSDSTYQYYANGQLSVQGSYTLTKDISPATGQSMDALILDGNNNLELFFEITYNTLTLYRGIIAADGTIETYEKIGN